MFMSFGASLVHMTEMENINVKVPSSEIEKLDQVVEARGYPSRSELIREAIRDKLDDEMSLKPEVLQRILKARNADEEDLIPLEEVLKKENKTDAGKATA